MSSLMAFCSQMNVYYTVNDNTRNKGEKEVKDLCRSGT